MPLATVLVASLGMIAASAAAENSTLLMASTALVVLSSIGMGIISAIYLAKIVEGWLAKTTL
ncbi:hypothetical protein [Nitrososphaera sp.]|uniref:hypothetical protein n=1 Tax=Nitrososphaera sp. TaxID=1971748 RepID=UPI002EDB9BBB